MTNITIHLLRIPGTSSEDEEKVFYATAEPIDRDLRRLVNALCTLLCTQSPNPLSASAKRHETGSALFSLAYRHGLIDAQFLANEDRYARLVSIILDSIAAKLSSLHRDESVVTTQAMLQSVRSAADMAEYRINKDLTPMFEYGTKHPETEFLRSVVDWIDERITETGS